MINANEARKMVENYEEKAKARIIEKADKFIAEGVAQQVEKAASEGRTNVSVNQPMESAVREKVAEKLVALGYEVEDKISYYIVKW